MIILRVSRRSFVAFSSNRTYVVRPSIYWGNQRYNVDLLVDSEPNLHLHTWRFFSFFVYLFFNFYQKNMLFNPDSLLYCFIFTVPWITKHRFNMCLILIWCGYVGTMLRSSKQHCSNVRVVVWVHNINVTMIESILNHCWSSVGSQHHGMAKTMLL